LLKEKTLVLGYSLTLLLGTFGIHLFYFRKPRRGTLYLLFSWTFIPTFLSLIDLFFVKKWTTKCNENNKLRKGLANAIKEPNEKEYFEDKYKQHGVKRDLDQIDNLRKTRYEKLLSLLNQQKYNLEIGKKKEHDLEQYKQKTQVPEDSSNNETLPPKKENYTSKNKIIKRLLASLQVREKHLIKVEELNKQYNKTSIKPEEFVEEAFVDNQIMKKENYLKLSTTIHDYISQLSKKMGDKRITSDDKKESFKDKAETVSPNIQKQETLGAMIKKQFSFYEESNIIIDKYSHLKTPQSIINDLKNIKDGDEERTFKNERNGIAFSISYSSGNEEFVKESIKYSQKRGTPFEHTPFQAYWPQFTSLNSNQTKWYFYWREQVLNKNNMNTDLSYIFIFVYELLNYSFNDKASFNISMMVRLYENYKESHPKLTHYLEDWIADMLLELGEQELAYEWRKEDDIVPSLYSRILYYKDSLNKISMNTWNAHINGYRETKFFMKHKHKIYKKFKESLPLLKEQYEIKRIDIIERWFEKQTHTYQRNLFGGAVIGRKRKQVPFSYEEYKIKSTLSSDITNLFRLAENVVRFELGEKREIKVDYDMLPDDMKDKIVNSRFKTVQKSSQKEQGSKIPDPPKEDKSKKQQDNKEETTKKAVSKIEFDWDEIKQKEEELNDIQTKIESIEEKDEEENVSTPFNTKDTESVNPSEEEIGNQMTELDNKNTTTSSSFEDMFSSGREGDYDEFLESLTNSEKEFIALFDGGFVQTGDAKDYVKKEGKMLGLFLTELNEKANEHFDDVLLEEQDETIELVEDYMEIVEMVRGVVNGY